MDRDRLFSFQELQEQELSNDCNIEEYEEALLERDKLIKNLIEEKDNLKKTVEIKENKIQNLDQKNKKITSKLQFSLESLKKISVFVVKSKQEVEKLKLDFRREISEMKAGLILNENSLKKQLSFRKNFLKKLKELRNKRSTMESENISNSEPYLNLITQNFQSLNQKIDDISNNCQETKTKNFLINFPENPKPIVFQSKQINKPLVFSSDNSMNLNNEKEKKNINVYKILHSTRSDHLPILGSPILGSPIIGSSRLDVNELEKIKEKYFGFEQKFKGLIHNLQNNGKNSKSMEEMKRKNEIFRYLERIEEKLGINAKVKDESFHLLNRLNYRRF